MPAGIASPAARAAPKSTLVRIFLAQESWSAGDTAGALADRLRDIAGPRDDGIATLVVLPPAKIEREPPKAEEFLKRFGAAAKTASIYLISAAVVRSGATRATEGFVVGPTGDLLLRTAKMTPDSLAGFTDTSSALDRPAAFPVARLPFGAVGLLIGEDMFRPGHLRALCFNGAEIVINPARETADAGFDARRDVATAIAYCHMVYVAAATGPSPSRTGLWDWQGNVTAPLGASAVSTVVDIETLRIARQQGGVHVAYASKNLPPMVRDALYAPAFAAIAASRLARPVPATRAAWAAESELRIAAQAHRAIPAGQEMPIYDAVLMQTPHRVIADAPDRKVAIARNIQDFLAMAEPYVRRPLSKLVMFGEFSFTAAGYRTVQDALSVTLTWPGPELELIAAFADKHKVYVAAQQLEHDPKFPGRVFNTAFLFDDSGTLVSRHRKLQCVDVMGTLPDTTPGSIYDRYVAEFNAENLWHVVDTPLGKLAPMICFENMFPEVAAIYALKGAEVFLHLTSEGWDAITETRYAWNAARRMHAMQSGAYVLSVNQGDDPNLRDPYHVIGESQVIDPYGRVTGMLRESRPGALVARVDLNLVRAARSDPRANLGIWDEPVVYADAYTRGHGVPNNLWADIAPDEFPYRDLAVYRQVVARYNERGVFTQPRSKASLR